MYTFSASVETAAMRPRARDTPARVSASSELASPSRATNPPFEQGLNARRIALDDHVRHPLAPELLHDDRPDAPVPTDDEVIPQAVEHTRNPAALPSLLQRAFDHAGADQRERVEHGPDAADEERRW